MKKHTFIDKCNSKIIFTVKYKSKLNLRLKSKENFLDKSLSKFLLQFITKKLVSNYQSNSNFYLHTNISKLSSYLHLLSYVKMFLVHTHVLLPFLFKIIISSSKPDNPSFCSFSTFMFFFVIFNHNNIFIFRFICKKSPNISSIFTICRISIANTGILLEAFASFPKIRFLWILFGFHCNKTLLYHVF